MVAALSANQDGGRRGFPNALALEGPWRGTLGAAKVAGLGCSFDVVGWDVLVLAEVRIAHGLGLAGQDRERQRPLVGPGPGG